MITLDEKTALQVLEALETRCGTNADERSAGGAITVLRQALEQAEKKPCNPSCAPGYCYCEEMAQQPKQEPVTWMYEWNGRTHFTTTNQQPIEHAHPHFNKSKPLYTEPPKRKPLTRDQALKIVAANPDAMTAIRMTEAAHGIKE